MPPDPPRSLRLLGTRLAGGAYSTKPSPLSLRPAPEKYFEKAAWESSILKISLLTLSRADSVEWCLLYADCKEGNSPWPFR